MEDTESRPHPLMSRAELNDKAKTLLSVAKLLMENGAETRRVFETVEGIGTKWELDELDILVTHRSVQVTVASGSEAVTRIIRVGTLGVNLSKIAAISAMFRKISKVDYAVDRIKKSLERISAEPAQYPEWVVLVMAGLACGGFCRIGGGDWLAFISCSISAAIGLWARKLIAKRNFQPMLCVFSAAFVSASIATLLTRSMGSDTQGAGVAASVLYLVPGIPMINAVADLVKGHLMTGLARALTVAITAAFVSSGLVLAMQIMGFKY